MKDKKLFGYSFAKVFYGLFMIWYGLNIMSNEKMTENSKYLPKSLNLIKLIGNSTDFGKKMRTKIQPYISMEPIITHSNDIIYFIGLLLIMGGFFGLCGYGISYYFVTLGLLLDLTFIHNLAYYAEETMKINVLKIISLLGGSYFLI